MKEPINKNAEYIIFGVKNDTVEKGYSNIYVDMNDLQDIVPLQNVILPNNKTVTVYDVITKEGIILLRIPIDNKTLEIWNNFKNNIDKDK